MSLRKHVPATLSDPSTWVDQHGDILYRYALARVSAPAAAEDLVQETFLAALRGPQTFAGGCAERSWFVAILKRKVVDFFRRRGREKPLPDDTDGAAQAADFDARGRWQSQPASWGDNPGSAFEQQEFWVVFRGCLGKLPPRLTAAFSLREMEGHSTEEITRDLNVTAGNLAVLLHRARLALRRCLEAHWFRTTSDGV